VFLYICMFMWLDVVLASASNVGQRLFIFGIQEFIRHKSLSGE
jgi:hypothetical protein